MSNPVLAPWRSVLGSCLAAISPPPCRVPPICAAPRATGIRRGRSFLPPAPMSASHRAGVVGSPLVWKCSGCRLRTKARWRRTPTPGPGKARANRSTSFRRLSRALLATPTRKKCSAAHEARKKGEPACAAEGSVYEPPAAPHCREARERACLRGEGNGWKKRKILNLPAVKTSRIDANQRKRGL